MWLLAPLDELADDGYPRRAQQLPELLEVVPFGQRPHAEGALPGSLGWSSCADLRIHLRV